MIRPSLLSLESSLFTSLKAAYQSDTRVRVRGIHPVGKEVLGNTDAILVTSQISESLEGTVITRLISRPLLQVAVYSNLYHICRQFQESVVEQFDQNLLFAPMVDQVVEWSFIERRIAPAFDAQTQLWVGTVDIRVHLAGAR